MDNLSIVLVEDDPVACQAFLSCADDTEDVSLVSITNNAAKAIEDIRDFLPNAVILDLELHHGCGSGLDVLHGLKKLALDMYPYILVTTHNSSPVTYEYACQLGADYIMFKHQQGYSEKSALDFLRMLKSVIQHKTGCSPFAQATTESPEQKSKRITRRITAELHHVGVNPKDVGYQYLIDAIQMVIPHPLQNICSHIAQKYKKTECSVERAMQNAISRAWKVTDIDELLHHYTAKVRSDKGVPTITEFVYYYANKIKNEY